MNNSEQHRLQCEARHVMKMTRDKRIAYYHGVLQHRKQQGMDNLIAEVNRQWRRANEKNAQPA